MADEETKQPEEIKLTPRQKIEAAIVQESFEAGRHIGRREALQTALEWLIAESLQEAINADK